MNSTDKFERLLAEVSLPSDDIVDRLEEHFRRKCSSEELVKLLKKSGEVRRNAKKVLDNVNLIEGLFLREIENLAFKICKSFDDEYSGLNKYFYWDLAIFRGRSWWSQEKEDFLLALKCRNEVHVTFPTSVYTSLICKERQETLENFMAMQEKGMEFETLDEEILKVFVGPSRDLSFS